jgi:molybdenum cofactor cytidylyltransferase
MKMVSGILLAAGLSRRLNGGKLFLKIGTKTVFEHSLNNMLASKLAEVIVVTGNRAGETERLIGANPVKNIYNPDYASGMSTSMKTGLEAVDSANDGYLFALADQPLVSYLVINRMLDEFQGTDKGIAVPVYNRSRGNPVIFARKYRDELLRLSGDSGAKQIVLNHPEDVMEVDVDEPAVLEDVDTREDYQKVKETIMPPTALQAAFDLKENEVISIIGAGGKTSLMFALAKELAGNGSKIITATTTKIWEPTTEQSAVIVLEKDVDQLLKKTAALLRQHNHVTVSPEKLGNGKLDSINIGLTARLAEICDYLIIEADGAANHPIKAPAANEPVIPENTTLHIPVIGLDAISKPAIADNAFRLPAFLEVTGLKEGDIIDIAAVVRLFTGRDGMMKNVPHQARVVPLLNKTDISGGAEKGKSLARAILQVMRPRIARVVAGQLGKGRMQVEVFQ